MTTPSDAQLAKIADEIFVMGDRAKTRLPTPANTGPAAFTTAMDAIATDARWQDAGIGVIDFTPNPLHPNVWLHNEGTPFRIGSASKIAMMLAAVQLRLDVRRILGLSPQIISTPAEFDALFNNRKLWQKAKPPWIEMKEILHSPPLISKIFDFTKHPVDFAGPDPDKQTDPANQKKIDDKLPPSPSHHLSWKTPPLTFSERLWLAGCKSDNVAATTCVSEIGVPYIKLVQRSYGLFDPARGMHLLGSGGYKDIPPKAEPPDPPLPRRLADVQSVKVSDKWLKKGKYDDDTSWVSGSAAALTAYMLALKTDALAVDPLALVGGLVACQTIRNNLADGGAFAIPSFMVSGPPSPPGGDGVADITNVKSQINKIGILRHDEGAENPLLCEFVYLETEEFTPPPAPRRNKMKYAVIVDGLIATPGAGNRASEKSAALGIAIHKALLLL
jgi:hypothetical protein